MPAQKPEQGSQMDLAEELIQEIIHQLDPQDDADCATLKSLSIVNKTFKVLSQRHLFSSISLLFPDTSASGCGDPLIRFIRFHELLNYCSPDIISYIRDVEIIRRFGHLSSEEYWNRVVEIGLPYDLQSLPRLRSFTLIDGDHGVDWAALPSAAQEAIRQVCARSDIRSVFLQGIQNLTLPTFRLGTALQVLTFVLCTFVPESVATPLYPPPHLDQLRLLFNQPAQLQPAFDACRHGIFDISRLRRLSIVVSNHTEHITSLVKLVSCLEELELSLMTRELSVDLSGCTSLRHLRFVIYSSGLFAPYDPNGMLAMNWLIGLLETLPPSNKFTKLTVDAPNMIVTDPLKGQENRMDVARRELDEFLVSPRFPEFKSLVINVYNGSEFWYHFEVAAMMVQQDMPHLWKHGMISLVNLEEARYSGWHRGQPLWYDPEIFYFLRSS
ncbi:hypothetical protein FISHEDRAFT_78389 [Fistulina hepatica ATCC 64428]|nr:hypothetical protein FISHEDRAFT_78389 [Fistulina hepatica ATCC 64428]